MPAGRRHYEEQEGVSTAAAVDLRLCAALTVFRRKMEAEADKTESQLAAGTHAFLKKVP